MRPIVVGTLVIVVVAAVVVLVSRWLIAAPSLGDFFERFPGQYALPAGAPVGFPQWVEWQHFLSGLFIALMIRSGLQIRREQRPAAYWTSRRAGARKVSLRVWFHQSIDLLWVVNGAVFIVLLFIGGQWMRIVPTSWAVFPNALSAGLQYASLEWPHDDGWLNYNSLQQLTYFVTIFIAAPIAILTGVRMSTVWPKRPVILTRAYPVEWARKLHFPTMIYFVAFIVVHVVLVLATGALQNLNHMYGGQDAVNWVGFAFFIGSLAVITAALIAARPIILASIARIFGTVGR